MRLLGTNHGARAGGVVTDISLHLWHLFLFLSFSFVFSERFSYFVLHVVVTTIMSTVLGKYSHLVSCDSSKLCSKEREKCTTKVN